MAVSGSSMAIIGGGRPDKPARGRAFEIFDGQIRWHADDPALSLADVLLPGACNSGRRRLRHAAML